MKMAIVSDIHGNLPALQAFLQDIESENVEKIICLGDTIAIGPYPSECLNILFADSRFVSIMGNHEEYYVFGIPNPIPDYMSEGEVRHQAWVRQLVGENYKEKVSTLPYKVDFEFNDSKFVFLHYMRENFSNKFKPIVENNVEDLDEVFEGVDANVIFFGHLHLPCDIAGNCRYLNPGSLGCSKDPIARYILLEAKGQETIIEKREAVYNKQPLFDALMEREVPEREFIGKIFFGAVKYK